MVQSFDIDPGNPGNDVTVTITDTADRISQAVSGTTLITGGVSPTNKTLQPATNFASNLESIVVRIDPNYVAGIRDVNFFIHDIDGTLNSWQEEVRGISASSHDHVHFRRWHGRQLRSDRERHLAWHRHLHAESSA